MLTRFNTSRLSRGSQAFLPAEPSSAFAGLRLRRLEKRAQWSPKQSKTHRLSRLIPSGEPRDVRGQALKPYRSCCQARLLCKTFNFLQPTYFSLHSTHGRADASLPRAAEAMPRSRPFAGEEDGYAIVDRERLEQMRLALQSLRFQLSAALSWPLQHNHPSKRRQ